MAKNPILRLEVNVPMVVSLSTEGPGHPAKSKFQTRQFLYTVRSAADGLEYSLFACEELSSAIDHLNLRAGELVEICKRVVARGESRNTEYVARRVQESRRPSHTAAEPSRLAQMPQTPTNQVRGARDYPQRAPIAPTPPPNVREMPSFSVAEEIAAGIHPAAQGVLTSLMSMCIQAALDAWLHGQSYAKSRGLDFQFSTENVQGSASTIFIQLARQGQPLLPRSGQPQGGSVWPN